MAKRIISAAIAIPVGLVVIFLNNEAVYYTAMTIISCIAVYELMISTKYVTNKLIMVLSLLFAAVTPFIFWLDVLKQYSKPIFFCFVVILFVIMLFTSEHTRVEQVVFAAVVSISIPLALSSIAFIRSRFPEHAMFLVAYTLISAWIGDAGAYFIGTFFGKHKMCPHISPKKTWEGFIGGIVTSAVAAVILSFGYEFVDTLLNNGAHTFRANWLYLTLLAIILSVLGVVGDLSASLVKRECSVKDFGNILPGHGGVLDRFDSVLFAAPFAYMAYQFIFPFVQV